MWETAKKNEAIENFAESEVFHLIQKEAEKCRFTLIDQSERMAECTVHRGNFSHGVKLFPPHLWNIIEGQVFYKQNGEWCRWLPTVKENKTRLDK